MTVARLRRVLTVSRPTSWIQTGLPFLVAAFAVTRELTPLLVIGTIYFLGPYNLLLHGVDEAHQVDTDPETVDDDDAATAARDLWIAISVTNLPFLIVLTILAGPVAGLALLLAVAAAIAYSDLPARTRERPILNSATSALHLVLPAACGFLVVGLPVGELPWAALFAFTAWAMATHALEGCRRAGADRAAGVASVATELGVRTTAAGALVGYLFAVVLAATQGPGGALAAVGLALYLLPATMVVLRPDDAVAEAAWGQVAGLDVLVGIWLGSILAWVWGIVRFDPWVAWIGLASGATIIVLFDVLVTRFAARRRTVPIHQRTPRETDESPLTIVVTGRDRAADLPACLAALRAQTHPDPRILVVDGASILGTTDLARGLLGDDGEVVPLPPAPPGWDGVGWARDVGARAADGDLILFVDASTVLAPVAVRILVEQLGADRDDMVSGLLRLAMPTWAERLTSPGFAMVSFGLVPLWLSRRTAGHPPQLAFGSGSLLIVRREAYLTTDGHAANPGSPRPAQDLARTFARAGQRVGLVHAADLGSSRQGGSIPGALEAWRRGFVAGAGDSLAGAVAVLLGEATALALPLALPIAAFLARAPLTTLEASLVPLLILLLGRLALAITQREPVATIVWHPLTVALMVIGQVIGIADFVVGRRPRYHQPLT